MGVLTSRRTNICSIPKFVKGTADAGYGTSNVEPGTSNLEYDGDIVVVTTYNARGQVETQTSPRGITTTYTYDLRDRVIATSAADLQRNHVYDVAGRLLSVTEPGNAAANRKGSGVDS